MFLVEIYTAQFLGDAWGIYPSEVAEHHDINPLFWKTDHIGRKAADAASMLVSDAISADVTKPSVAVVAFGW